MVLSVSRTWRGTEWRRLTHQEWWRLGGVGEGRWRLQPWRRDGDVRKWVRWRIAQLLVQARWRTGRRTRWRYWSGTHSRGRTGRRNSDHRQTGGRTGGGRQGRGNTGRGDWRGTGGR